MPLSPLPSGHLSRARRIGWPALIFCVAAFALYEPALNRVFVNDQVWYFAELDGKTSLLEGLRHYDYAATRRYWKGDDALFRPLLFVWLAVANRLFSYHHVWWNAANVALHALVVLFLFRLLVTIRPSPFAFGAAMLFLVMTPSMELVLWHHLGGYLLACLFLVIGLRAFVRLTERSDVRPSLSVVASYALALTAASLFYEVMAVVTLLAGAIVLGTEWRRWQRLRRRVLCAVGFPVAMFSLLYAFHVLRVARLSYVDRSDVQSIFGVSNLISTVFKVPAVIARWTLEVAVPSAVDLRPLVFGRLVKDVAFSWLEPAHLASAALFSMMLVLLGRTAGRRHVERRLPLLVLLLGAVLAYTAIMCLGRPQAEVLAVTYYLYVFCLLLVATGYALVDFDAIGRRDAAMAGVIVAALIVLNATGTRTVALEIGRVNGEASRYLTVLSRFVDEHKAEPDFSFAISVRPSYLDPDIVLREGYPDDVAAPVRRSKLTEILFAPYYDEQTPKYIVRGR